MPAKSKAQQKYAGMSQSPAGRAKLEAEGKKPMPVNVAKEYAAGTGKSLPQHVGKSKKGK